MPIINMKTTTPGLEGGGCSVKKNTKGFEHENLIVI